MKTKADLETIEKGIDFEAVSKRLETLTSSGELKRRKKVSDLLDKVKPALIKARENKVSYQALTDFLTSSGIPVSEPTLRQYLSQDNKQSKRKKNRKSSVARAEKEKKPTLEKIINPEIEADTKKLPPRLARRNK